MILLFLETISRCIDARAQETHAEACLQGACVALTKRAEELLPPLLRLPPDMKITCRHGKHRIAAAHQFIDPGDKW